MSDSYRIEGPVRLQRSNDFRRCGGLCRRVTVPRTVRRYSPRFRSFAPVDSSAVRHSCARTREMATFYVLPPRTCLEDSLGGLIGKLLPGLPLPVDAWDAVVERLAELGGWPADVYLIPRDDLSPG